MLEFKFVFFLLWVPTFSYFSEAQCFLNAHHYSSTVNAIFFLHFENEELSGVSFTAIVLISYMYCMGVYAENKTLPASFQCTNLWESIVSEKHQWKSPLFTTQS